MEDVEAEPLPDDHERRKKRSLAVRYSWRFVSTQLKNSKGEIFYPVRDDRDREWASRLEWVVGEHLHRAEDDLDQLQADFEGVLRQSKEVHFRKYDQQVGLCTGTGAWWPGGNGGRRRASAAARPGAGPAPPQGRGGAGELAMVTMVK